MKRHQRLIALVILVAVLMGVMGTGSVVLARESAQQSDFAAPIMIVNTSFLNIRSGPGTQYNILLTVVGGTSLPVLGVASDGVWYQVSTIAGPGWLNSQYAIPRGSFQNIPLVAAPAFTQTAPSMSFSGAVNNSDDTAVDLGFSSGREWGLSVTVAHPLYTGPSINSAVIRNMPVDSSVIYSVIGATFNEGVAWVQVDVPGVASGWLEEGKVLFRPFACVLSAVQFTQSTELKLGPDGSGGEGVLVSGGSEAYLLDKVDTLYKVELISGSVGWVEEGQLIVRDRSLVNSAYCEAGGAATIGQGNTQGTGSSGPSAPAVSASTARVVINTGFLNVRSGPGAQYASVATLPGGTELAVLGFAPDGVWYFVSGTFGTGWLNSEFTLFRGDGRSLPIIRDAGGTLARPMGNVNTGTYTLYAAPNLTLGVVGSISGPRDVEVVARNADFTWVQVNVPGIGFGWIQADFITMSGDTSLIPVVQ